MKSVICVTIFLSCLSWSKGQFFDYRPGTTLSNTHISQNIVGNTARVVSSNGGEVTVNSIVIGSGSSSRRASSPRSSSNGYGNPSNNYQRRSNYYQPMQQYQNYWPFQSYWPYQMNYNNYPPSSISANIIGNRAENIHAQNGQAIVNSIYSMGRK